MIQRVERSRKAHLGAKKLKAGALEARRPKGGAPGARGSREGAQGVERAKKKVPRQKNQENKCRGQEDRHPSCCYPYCHQHLGCFRPLCLSAGEFSLWLLAYNIISPSLVTYSFLRDLLHHCCPCLQ